MLCSWWWCHTPTPGRAVVALSVVAIFAAIEGLGWQRVLWLLVLFLFAGVEFRAIDKDRKDFAKQESDRRDEENRQFGGIAGDLNNSIQQGANQFQATMHEFKVEQTTVAQLKQQLYRFQRQAGEAQLSSMSPSELTARAREAAQLMRDYSRSYELRDDAISRPYDDHLVGFAGHMTKKEIDDWVAEEKRLRNDLKLSSEADAEKIIEAANRVRVELLKHVPSWGKLPQDDREAKWFENPRLESGTLSLLFALSPHADYLNDLAKRARGQRLVLF